MELVLTIASAMTLLKSRFDGVLVAETVVSAVGVDVAVDVAVVEADGEASAGVSLAGGSLLSWRFS